MESPIADGNVAAVVVTLRRGRSDVPMEAFRDGSLACGHRWQTHAGRAGLRHQTWPAGGTRRGAGRRDVVMLSVLCDIGARAQELIDLNAHDARLRTPVQFWLLGKGREVRVVPLMDVTAKLCVTTCGRPNSIGPGEDTFRCSRTARADACRGRSCGNCCIATYRLPGRRSLASL